MRGIISASVWGFIVTCNVAPNAQRQRLGPLPSSSSDTVNEATPTPTPPPDELKGPFPCVALDAEFKDLAKNLAVKLALPLVAPEDLLSRQSEFSHALSFSSFESGTLIDYALGIQYFDTNVTPSRRKKGKRQTMKPFVIDFCPPPSSRLGKRTSGESGPDLLTKALAPRKGFPAGATVYDLTAGLGQDSLLIAIAGAKSVHMVERDPIVAALLEDALRRLQVLSRHADDEDQRQQATALSRCLSFELNDGREVLRQLTDSEECPDIIYLDPMFPSRRKSASVKKNMQVLHGLLESNQLAEEQLQEEAELLQAAYQVATARVVVKRPINAVPLGGALVATELKPSYQTKGSVNRWDVYVKSNS